MSSSYEYSYSLEAARRRRIYLNRLSSTTEQFYNRYSEQYQQMRQNGYTAYIPSEMGRLDSDLFRLRNLLTNNPEEARELSFEIGSYIRSMSSLAHGAREQFDRAERMRMESLKAEREHAQSELIHEYFEILKTITNPIVVNYSINAMQEVKKEIESGKIVSRSQLQERTSDIKAAAERKADEWKESTIKKNRKKDVAAVIDEAEERIRKESIENKEKTQEFLESISRMRLDLEKESIDADDIEKQVAEFETAIDNELISEETRRETVKAIIKQLKKQEFSVKQPQIITADGKNYVKIIAKQPSGKRAICNVDLHGKIAYKFDNYEGMTCLKDIEKFNVDLANIYSIKLSDERVLWKNPDKLLMDASSVPKTDGRNA